MTLKEQINAKYISAFKSKNIIVKDALGMLKAKITEAEKKNGTEVTEAEIIAVIQSEVKKRQQTLAALEDGAKKGGEIDHEKLLAMSSKESLEIDVLSDFLPKQLTEEEIHQIVKDHVATLPVFNGNNMGQCVGAMQKIFKEKYAGRYDGKLVKEVTEKILKG